MRKINSRNYNRKLSGEIITRNYQLVYYVAKNVGIIGILPYPKTKVNLIAFGVMFVQISLQLEPSDNKSIGQFVVRSFEKHLCYTYIDFF